MDYQLPIVKYLEDQCCCIHTCDIQMNKRLYKKKRATNPQGHISRHCLFNSLALLKDVKLCPPPYLINYRHAGGIVCTDLSDREPLRQHKVMKT